MPDTKSQLSKQIETEITDYYSKEVNIGDDVRFSQYYLSRRIVLFENKEYPNGKFDSQGNYKYWFDIIGSRIDSEVKNIDFDTKDIEAFSEREGDNLPIIVTNLTLKEYLRNHGQSQEINDAIEEGAGWGNILWKKVSDGYERADLRRTYIINQTAKTVDQTPIVEWHELTQSDLRAKNGTWKYIDEVIMECGRKEDDKGEVYTYPLYDVFERNGEVKLSDIKEFKGEKIHKDDDKKYVNAKVVAAGKKTSLGAEIKYILYAEQTIKKNSDRFKEYHRGRYKGRWFREGIIELLFDLQVRANQIGNQIAQGLEYASKTIFTYDDNLVAQNFLTDLNNGDFLKTKSAKQLEVRMQGLDQLIADWNRIVQLANEITNSREVVQGEAMPSGTPFRMGAMLNQNANKLYDFIREKLEIPFREMFEEWIVPQLIKDLKAKDIIRLTGSSDMIRRVAEMIADDWYARNLFNIGPHSSVVKDYLIQKKTQEILDRKQVLMSELESFFEGFRPNVSIVITGENTTLDSDLQTLGSFIALEQDPIRRSAMIEMAMNRKGIDVGALPKTEAPPTNAVAPAQTLLNQQNG